MDTTASDGWDRSQHGIGKILQIKYLRVDVHDGTLIELGQITEIIQKRDGLANLIIGHFDHFNAFVRFGIDKGGVSLEVQSNGIDHVLGNVQGRPQMMQAARHEIVEHFQTALGFFQ